MTALNRSFPFKRNAGVSPIMVPATDTPSQVEIGPLPDGVTSFAMINSYPVYVRLEGSSGTFSAVTAGTGWLVPPGHFGVYSTRYPKWVSCVAVERPGFPIKDGNGALLYPDAKLELLYGSGE